MKVRLILSMNTLYKTIEDTSIVIMTTTVTIENAFANPQRVLVGHWSSADCSGVWRVASGLSAGLVTSMAASVFGD